MTSFNLAGSNDDVAKAEASANAGQAQDGMVFNLEGVEEQTAFEVIPKGTYAAVVDSFEFGESKSGNSMITVIYELTDPEYAGRKIYDWMVLGGNGAKFGLAKVKKFLVRVCPEIPIGSFNPTEVSEEGTTIGKECMVTLKIQTQKSGDYKGEKRNTVNDILAADNAGSFL